MIMEFNDFVISTGEKKILISAPHAVDQIREGKPKFAEPETALLAKEFNKLGYPTIVKTKNANDDANYDLDCGYKRELLKFCRENDIQFVVDLHQLSEKREIDICFGTGDANNKNLLGKSEIIDSIKEIKNNFIITVNDPFPAPPRTVSGFCASNNIPALQIEINSRLIAEKRLNATQFDSVLKYIIDILEVIEKNIFKNNLAI